MQLLAGIADAIGERLLDVHVHVFQCDLPLEIACANLIADSVQAVNNGGHFLVGQHAHAPQHGGVRNAALDVVGRQARIKADGLGKGLDQWISGFVESTVPELHAGFGGRRTVGVVGHDLEAASNVAARNDTAA